MLFINANLSKNQVYKLKNYTNKVPTIIKQDDIEFLFQIFLHVILLSAIYFRVIIVVGFWFVDKKVLFWRIRVCCYEILSLIFRQ